MLRADPMSYTITEGYAPGCIGRITQLHAQYYAATSNFGVAFEAKVAKELGEFCRAYVPGRDGLWLAQGSQIEGSVAIDGSHAADDGAQLRWFIASEALKGRGFGRALLDSALNFCDDREYKRVYLWTFSGLNTARHLYESLGFRLELQRLGTQWGTPVEEQRFVRDGS